MKDKREKPATGHDFLKGDGKRNRLQRSWHNNKKNLVGMNLGLNVFKLVHQRFIYMKTVSYTHLDVYKRQASV